MRPGLGGPDAEGEGKRRKASTRSVRACTRGEQPCCLPALLHTAPEQISPGSPRDECRSWAGNGAERPLRKGPHTRALTAQQLQVCGPTVQVLATLLPKDGVNRGYHSAWKMIFALLGRPVHDPFKYELLSILFFFFLIVIFA